MAVLFRELRLARDNSHSSRRRTVLRKLVHVCPRHELAVLKHLALCWQMDGQLSREMRPFLVDIV